MGLGVRVGSGVGSAVVGAVGAGVAVGSGVGVAVGSGVGSAVGLGVRVGSGVGSAVVGAVGAGVAVGSAVGSAVGAGTASFAATTTDRSSNAYVMGPLLTPDPTWPMTPTVPAVWRPAWLSARTYGQAFGCASPAGQAFIRITVGRAPVSRARSTSSRPAWAVSPATRTSLPMSCSVPSTRRVAWTKTAPDGAMRSFMRYSAPCLVRRAMP